MTRAIPGAILLTFLVLCAIWPTPLTGQDGTPSSSITAMRGHPFSAVKFTRTVHVNKDGSTSTIVEKAHALVARDTDGRILLAVGPDRYPDRACDLPDVSKRPLCESWLVIIFDPIKGVIWHWGEGAKAAKTGYVEIHLSSEQVEEGERLTAMNVEVPNDEAKSGIHVQDLGEKIIEGVSARGSRTTTRQEEERLSAKVTIDEVWTSAQMGVVLRAIHGDLDGTETISGLERLSLQSSEVMFQLPTTRRLFEYFDQSRFADDDLAVLATWLVH